MFFVFKIDQLLQYVYHQNIFISILLNDILVYTYVTHIHTDKYPYYPGTNFQDALSWQGVNVTDDDGSSSIVPTPFDRPALFIHTANKLSATMIQNAYEEQGGINSNSISIHQLNSNELRLLNRTEGWEISQPDLFGFIHRITLAQDGYEEDFNSFLNLTFPIKFYIASNTEDDEEDIELFTPVLRSRETGGSGGMTGLPSEKELLESSLNDLTKAIQNKYNVNTTSMTGLAILNFTRFDSYDNWDEVHF